MNDRPCVMQPADDCSTVLPCARCPVGDAARAYVAAWHANADAAPADWQSARARLDAAQHDLFALVDGECSWCAEGSCPVLNVEVRG